MKTELVTTLKRKATDILTQIADDHEPVLITQHGKPAAYIVDVDTFEVMESRISLLEGIARGEKSIDDGRTLSHEEAQNRMSRWLD